VSETGHRKCACTNCAGRIEFPVQAAGMVIECPHCGGQTALVAPVITPPAAETPPRLPAARPRPRSRSRLLLPLAATVVVGLALAVALAVLRAAGRRALTVEGLTLHRAGENSPGAVTGLVRNQSRRAAEDVRVGIELRDARGELLWETGDFTPSLAGGKTWSFHAPVLDPNVATTGVARVQAR
jgi:hypothetical protein